MPEGTPISGNYLHNEKESKPSISRRFSSKYRWTVEALLLVLFIAFMIWIQVDGRAREAEIRQKQAENYELQRKINDELQRKIDEMRRERELRMQDAQPAK